MINFKKVFNFKIISIPIAAIFLLNSIVYGIDLPQKACLRKPLDFNKLGDPARYLRMLEQQRTDDLRLKLLDMLKLDSKALQEARKELFIIIENSKEEKVFEEGGSFTEKFLGYLERLKIKEDAEGGVYKVIKTGQDNLIYLIEDINGNKFLMGKEGEFSAIVVPEKDDGEGEFFVELDNIQSLQLVRALRKALGNSRPAELDEDKFFYSSVFSARSAQGLLDTISKHPILSDLFNLIADKCSGLRLSGGFYLGSQSDADGYYLHYAEWIGWRQDVKWDTLESLPEAILGHEALHHLFAEIFSKDEALSSRIKKHIEENHKPLLTWLKNHPSYKQGDEMRHIDEALAYSFQAAIEGSLITRGGSVLCYSDLKLFKELGLLPEMYLPGKLLPAFPGNDPVQNGFFKILKVLHDTRFENSGKDLKDVLQEYVSREIGEEKPDYWVLFTIGDFTRDLNDAENLYNKIIETAKDDLGIKAMAMLLGPIRLGNIRIHKKGFADGEDTKQAEEASKRFIELLGQDGAVENFLRMAVSMNMGSGALKGLLLGIDYKGIISGKVDKLEKDAEKKREEIAKTPEVVAKRISDKIELYQQLIVILHEQEISYVLLKDEEKHTGVMRNMADAYDRVELLKIQRERLLKNERQYAVVRNLLFNSEMRAKRSKAGKRLDSLRVEELELLREKLKEAIGSVGLVDLIIEEIANRGSLYIDETGQVRGNQAVLKLIAEINEISLGQLLRPVLFHEKVHDLLDRIFEKLKKPFLEGLERELSKATSNTSIGLRDDVIKTMERYFGKFDSVDKLLEDLIAEYYTYKFCGRDKDIFETKEMKSSSAIIEEYMKQHFFASGAASMIKIGDKWHFISPNKKDLNALFSINGENTKEAQIAKLKELFIESKVLGGKSGIKFEKSEGILRLYKALGRLFFRKYPIAAFLRSMDHGGSDYDIEPFFAIESYLRSIADTAELDDTLDNSLKVRFRDLFKAVNRQLKSLGGLDPKIVLREKVAEILEANIDGIIKEDSKNILRELISKIPADKADKIIKEYPGLALQRLIAKIPQAKINEIIKEDSRGKLQDLIAKIPVAKIEEAIETSFEGDLRALIKAVPKNKIEAIEENVILDWENRFNKSLEVFKKSFEELETLEKQMQNPSEEMSNDTRQSIIEDIGTTKDLLKEFITDILTDGANRTKGIVEKKEVNPNEIIDKAIAKKMINLSGRGISVKFKKDENIPNVLVNPRQIRQIITNILVNAEKLSKKLTITEIVINMKLSEKGKVIIEITDNGLGFTDEMLSTKQEQDGSYEVIFSLNTTYGKGSGFGLAENDYLAMINNGGFRVFSRPSGSNRGSTFIIELEPVANFPTLRSLIKTFKETHPSTDI